MMQLVLQQLRLILSFIFVLSKQQQFTTNQLLIQIIHSIALIVLLYQYITFKLLLFMKNVNYINFFSLKRYCFFWYTQNIRRICQRDFFGHFFNLPTQNLLIVICIQPFIIDILYDFLDLTYRFNGFFLLLCFHFYCTIDSSTFCLLCFVCFVFSSQFLFGLPSIIKNKKNVQIVITFSFVLTDTIFVTFFI
eukprot:TRINITY_DN18607_c0_g2_i1.p2 TRINITY_DN18607_c0_g2~~TRINITY_DN18607_c0_g2_i1.p2  ORF type:complete len:192 (+),score=-24.86 TRINITY_DN18607_c0_g2_i1:73-648(+)